MILKTNHSPSGIAITLPERDVQLDETSEQFLLAALDDFVQSAYKKFVRGQREHGGHITDRPALPEIKNETIDQWFYAKSAEYRERKHQELYAKAVGEAKRIQSDSR